MGVEFQFYKTKKFRRSSSQQCKLLTTHLYPKREDGKFYVTWHVLFVYHNKELGRYTRRFGPAYQLLFKLNFLSILRTFFLFFRGQFKSENEGPPHPWVFPTNSIPASTEAGAQTPERCAFQTSLPHLLTVYLTKLFNFSKAQFPHLQNEDNIPQIDRIC